jgi:hypothetical protein
MTHLSPVAQSQHKAVLFPASAVDLFEQTKSRENLSYARVLPETKFNNCTSLGI